jgi:hypothetical protein
MKKIIISIAVLVVLISLIRVSYMHNVNSVQAGTPISTVQSSSSMPMLIANLEIGSSGPQVDILNTFLMQKGFLGGGDYKGFGSSTYIAVQAFQVSQGITPANGIVGPLTRSIINSLLSEINLPPTPTSLMRDLEIGSSGQDVFILQNFLKDKGFLLQDILVQVRTQLCEHFK